MDVRKVTQRAVRAGDSLELPPGAVSSPFEMARQYAGGRFDLDVVPPPPPPPSPRFDPAAAAASSTTNKGENMDKRTAPPSSKGRRGPHMATRAKETLKSCGPLTLEQFAEGLGIDMKTARTLAKNGIQKGHWKREQHADGEKLVLVTVAPSAASARGASGLKRHLAKQAGQPVQQSVRPTRQSAPALPAADQPVPAAQFGLFNTGEFRIEYLGQEMKLPRHITREMVAYLDKIASAFEE